ncbi:cell cycle checkpoint control protein RAD9A-like isoform X2 [Mercenaria mercenaria]|uniref:cell cycle checkpoint control protein RAD9A-like isoform X2 n=1 Tax=Mercenaria mercenaria TaxID=6596 RepID=UPI00234ED3B2|nr:cell cycle checkpoint control protein RAD9A-like isoform X2 [Mercenaria mercenaria]
MNLIFGRGIHSLSKIGEELYIEPLEHGLALRTVNSSRSAYACFLFAPSFFQHYDDGSGDISSQDSDDTLRCKIAMKSIMTVFRSLSSLEKSVERCKIRLNMKDSRLVFQLHCRHGIVKTHNLAFIECETLQAVFSRDMCPNALTASSKLLCDAVMNFQNSQEEVTLIVNPQKIVLKNYVEDEPDPTKVMHTNLSLEPDEFDDCQIGVDTEVTFCLKELRAILAFSEATTLPLTLQFETAGRPIVFTIDSDSTFEGNFVLATLADQQTQSQAPTQARFSSTQKRTQSRTSKAVPQRPRSFSISKSKPGNNGDSLQSVRKSGSSNDLERSQRLESAYDELMNDDDDFDEMMIQNDTTIAVQNNARTTPSERLNKSESVSRVNSVKTVNARGDNSVKTVRSNSPVAGCSKSSEESPVIPVLGSKVKIADTSVTDVAMEDDVNQDEDDDEVVPGTPPAKRFRSLFFGSSQASQTQTQSKSTDLSTSRVLAQDSDED